MRSQLRPRTPAQAGNVHSLDEPPDLPDGSDEAIFLMNMREAPESIPTDDLPSTESSAHSAEQDHLLLVSHTPAARIPGGKPKGRPGWVNRRPNGDQRILICHGCYKVDDHYSPKCDLDPFDDAANVVANYESLTTGQKAIAPTQAYRYANSICAKMNPPKPEQDSEKNC